MLTTVLFVCLAYPVVADSFSSSGYARGAGTYLDRPGHAHAAALSSAVTAWHVWLTGIQHNPAILDGAKGFFGCASYVLLSDDRQLIAADNATPLGDYCVLGLSIRSHTVGKIEHRNEYGILEGTFASKENAFTTALAGRLPHNISIAGRLRYINQTFTELSNYNGHGIGCDAGVLWRPFHTLSIAASALNLGSYIWWASGHRDIVLPQARAGVHGSFLDGRLHIEIDGVKTLRQPVDAMIGMEYNLFNLISVRAGATTSIDIDDRSTRDPDISLGVGVHYRFLGFDYAMVIPTDNTKELLSHLFSLVLYVRR